MSHSQHLNAEGVAIPSVSQIPGIFSQDMSGFEDWICKGLGPHKCCTKAKREFYKESANLGHDIHALREAFLRGESFAEGVPEYQAQVFDPVAKFYKESGYKPLVIGNSNGSNTEGIELKMTGKEFGGTLDGAGTFSVTFWEGERSTFWDRYSMDYLKQQEFPDTLLPNSTTVWIEDLKIKSKLDKLHPLQLYGYALLFKEVYGIDAPWGLIIRREKKVDKRPEIQLRGYYLPAYKQYWDASLLMWGFLNA